MGRLANALFGRPSPSTEDTAPAFAVDADSIDPAVFGLASYTSSTAPAARISRREAIQVPAVKRCRDLIAGSLGSLPIDLFNPDRSLDTTSYAATLLAQPERGIPRSVSMTRTVEDLLFEQVAWWQVTDKGFGGWPVWVRRRDPRDVTVDEATGLVYIDGKVVADDNLIKFESPNDPLLVAGARAIRTCLLLDAAAARHADGAPPLDYLTPDDPATELDDTEVVDLLTSWQVARQARSTAYIPGGLKYANAGWSPEQLQLADARQHAVLEIARCAGVDPEELGVSTTSRTYANQFDRRKQFTDFTLGGYRTAVEDRLSMGDVSPRGHYARFRLSDFLRSDDLTRYQTYEVGLRVGAVTRPEIRAAEDKAPLTPEEELGMLPATTVAASREGSAAFDTAPELRLDAPGAQAFEVDVERRTIKGLAVPYGRPAQSKGQLWQFSKGTLKYADVRRVKLWIQHDQAQAVGVATELDDRDDGLYPTFKIARGQEGDKALSLAEDGVLDGLSIGLGQGGKFQRDKSGVNHAVEAPLMEISLTPAPSFDDARVHQVAASAETEGITMAETTVTDPAPAVDFSALSGTLTAAIRDGFAGIQTPQREVVPATAGSAVVREELPYRFNGSPGQFSFLEDLKGVSQNSSDAMARLDAFMGEAFAVTTTNVAALNPSPNRPELYVPNLSFTRPLWDLVSTGTIDNKTPFTVPKFSAAAGLVATHTEGTEPTPGSFSATSQTVTPTAVSGKIEINREVWDQGGNPQTDGIIWGEMLNGYYEALEARIATLLNGLALTETNLASATGTALLDAVTAVIVGTQYARGGNRFTAFAADQMLFQALVNAADTAGRKLLPIINPQNAQGSTGGTFDTVFLGNLAVRAAWALNVGVANAYNSYLFVPSSVWAWASPPARFTFEYQVKSIDMAVWGYGAAASLRDTDVKRIDYTTADV